MTKPNSNPVPMYELRKIVDAYKAEADLSRRYPDLTKRKAERALRRLRAACDEVLRAIDSLPDELQTFYSGPLSRAAREIELEVSARLHHLPNKIPRSTTPRTMLEARIAQQYLRYWGRITTYDPRRSEGPRIRADSRGKRGGGLAQLLLTAYGLAGITPPADLTPILKRLRREFAEPPKK